jgi:hypothetical protein
MNLHLFASLDPDQDWDPNYHKTFIILNPQHGKCTVVDLYHFGTHKDGDHYSQIQKKPDLDHGHQKSREHTNDNPEADPEK